MSIQISNATNSAELLEALRAINISVPARVDGRTTDHVETWTGTRLMSTLAMAGRLQFPLSVTHRDRPDILIRLGEAEIGLEITEAISQQYAAYSALAEREFPDVFLEPAHFRWGSPEMTVDQMRQLLRKDRMTSSGWVGDRPEIEWGLFIHSVVDNKLAKLAQAGFAKFGKNWLAIYDNLTLPANCVPHNRGHELACLAWSASQCCSNCIGLT